MIRSWSLIATLRSRAAAVPAPLACLLVVVAVFGIAWAMLEPPLQSPDAFTHYAYAESLATRAQLPGRPGYPESSSSLSALDRAVGAHRIQWSVPEAKPAWDPAGARHYRRASENLARDDGAGPTPSQNNPPLYYAYAAIGYLTGLGGEAADRVNVVQLWGVALLLATTTGVWLLVGEALGRRRILQLAAATVAGLEPMQTFISTSINPDALLITMWTFWLWAGTRVLRRGALPRDVFLLCELTAAAILTKLTSYALLPALGLALFLGWRARPAAERVGGLRVFAPAVLVLVLPVAAWIEVVRHLGHASLTVGAPSVSGPHPFSLPNFLNYLWQFYLPRLPGQLPFPVPVLPPLPWPRILPGLPVWNIWIRQGIGVFGWIDVYMPNWVYGAVAACLAVVGVGTVTILARVRSRLAWGLAGFYALTLLSLLAVAHEVEFQSLVAGSGAFSQGRYLLPLIGLLGLAVALILSRLPPRLQGACTALVMAGLPALQLVALGTVARTFYT